MKLCSIEGCWGKHAARGFCKNHYYQKYHANEFVIKTETVRNHSMYITWWGRKRDNLLSEEWLDFHRFLKDILPKPEGEFFLLRVDGNKPFGPTNFKWQEHLRRKEGESQKDWWARKREARLTANPAMESDRNIKRSFGLNREQYNEILKSQNDGCAICGKPETSVGGKTRSLKQLAVDHCHNSKKIRGLLCSRCNTTLGKIEDNVELLQKMIDYLNKHKEL